MVLLAAMGTRATIENTNFRDKLQTNSGAQKLIHLIT